MALKTCVLPWIFAASCFLFLGFAYSRVPQEEVNALEEIVSTMGADYWNFSADSCEIQAVGLRDRIPPWSETAVKCEPSSANDSQLHVVRIVLKGLSLPGVLPPELNKLPYIRSVDFAYNYLSGNIPIEWASLGLTFVSVLVNRLSGEIPKELGNITSLTYLNLEGNYFSGNIPSELGKLINLQTLMMSSNRLNGTLPTSFSALINLTDFRINDNSLSGLVPDFIQNWPQLNHLELQASGLEGPIPSNLSLLGKLIDLRISDISMPTMGFPSLSSMAGLQTLVLRNCNISGEMPADIWNLKNLTMMDVSFNNLVGEIPSFISARSMLKFVFLTGNKFTGPVPDSILKDGINVDLSYNNFTWQDPQQPACQPNLNLYLNLYKSSSTVSTLQSILPCTNNFTCPRYGCSLHVNAGGSNLLVKENNEKFLYEGDAGVDGGAARYYRQDSSFWGFSSTGDFWDYLNGQVRYIQTVESGLSGLYATARLSPLSLTYYRYCLENGSYTVSLHFAEIVFTNDNTYNSLGRRIFDIYIQGNLVQKDFNIEDEANGAQRPLIIRFNATVTDNTLEIRFAWAGKGTIRIPHKGHFGPMISAISVIPEFKVCRTGDRKSITAYVIAGVISASIIFFVCGFFWWKVRSKGRKQRSKDFDGLELQMALFTLKQLKSATNNFHALNKIGEGGFGPVYKGQLFDGTSVAVKQLSSQSRQGNREFLNEIGMISCLQHPNLVKLHGCCIEGDQLLLVYEYMENNSLAHAIFDSADSHKNLDWETRFRICIGVARGLAFLHEESILKVVHRDIKATNVLLDRELNPKISDFGLAKLNEDERTHISTRIAGTIGYMAPEYALWGYLTYKADVYSFGVVLLEIVSGKNNNNFMPSNHCFCLLDWACYLQQSGNLEELLDSKLAFKVNKEEAERVVKIALLCTNATPSVRPTMTEVLGMLEGRTPIPDITPDISTYTEDVRFKAIKDFRQERPSDNFTGSQTLNSTPMQTEVDSTSSSATELLGQSG